MKFITIILIIFYSGLLHGQTPQLFSIVQDDKIGYINEKGVIVIKPTYLSGNDFSEGLAAVRQYGQYGYIDMTGRFVINPSYDFASDFYNGLAAVYKDGKPLFIDKTGKIVLPEVYRFLTFIDNKKAIVKTYTNKVGVIDILSKKLLIDTVFSFINDFKNGAAVVNEYVSPDSKTKKIRTAVIDVNGEFIVPFGKYETIEPFVDGFAVVKGDESENDDEGMEGVIDTLGNLLFKRMRKNNSYIEGDFYDGLAKVNLYKYWIPEEKGILRTSQKNYEGFINLKGEVVLNDTNYIYVNEFSCGRAFVKKKNGDYILIDRNFKQIGNTYYSGILNEKFQNGYAIVETQGGYGIIDTMANFVAQPQYDDIDQVGILNGYFFFFTDYIDSLRYGISDIHGTLVAKAIFSEFDRRGFVNGLLKVVINDKLAYLNKKGEIVWQQKDEKLSALAPLNIDFMNRGYFYAYSASKILADGSNGGWAVSSNRPKKTSKNQFPDKLLALTIDTSKIDTFATKYMGYKLFISNTTNDTISFNVQDSRLYLKLQAQDPKGEWRDIEYLPSSWCGNSYHTIKLPPDAFWSFSIPKYHGEFITNIRAELTYIDKLNPKKGTLVYSRTIRGGINPGQFWNKKTYHPGGLMDPYND
jgi:hypothetical protein